MVQWVLQNGWPAASEEEAAYRRKTLARDGVAVIVIAALCLLFFAAAPSNNIFKNDRAGTSPEEGVTSLTRPPRSPSSPTEQRISVVLFVLSALVLWSDIGLTPAPKRSDVVWNTIGVIGHAAYFTVQTLMLQTVYFAVGVVDAFTDSPRLEGFLCTLALWTATQSVALCVLFLKHNWTEARWRSEVYKPMEAAYPGWGELMLFTHITPAVLGLADLALLRDPVALHHTGPELMILAIAAFVYGTAYTAWLVLFERYLSPGTWIYPFAADLRRPRAAAAFVVVQSVFIILLAATLRYLFVSLRI